MAPPSGLWVEGTDAVLQLLPGGQAVHPLQEQLAAGLTLLPLVFQVGKCRLVHRIPFLYRSFPGFSYYAIMTPTCSEYP